MQTIDSFLQKWKIKNIIFDLDGTLVDTLDQHIRAFQILFEKIGVEIPYNHIADNMGRTPKDTLLSLLPKLKDDNNKLISLAKEKEEILSSLLIGIQKFDGAANILSYLKSEGYPLCLASSTPRFNVIKILESTNLLDYFNIIITGEDITKGKPDPEVFLVAAKKANISSMNSLVIGDSPHDILAAKNAQMKVIVILTGKHQKNDILKLKPDGVFNSLNDLLIKT